MKTEITRRLQFAYGHRVFGHEGACANLHGHNGVVFITAQAKQLDSIGRVIDFSVLKQKFEAWINAHWDHAFLWNELDPVGRYMFGTENQYESYNPVREEIEGMRNFRCAFNPTAENMAEYLLYKVAPILMLNTDVEVVRVQLWETENCDAVASLEGSGTFEERQPIPTLDLQPENAL